MPNGLFDIDPIFTPAAQTFVAGQRQKQAKELASRAFMGDPDALASLAIIDPQAAQQARQMMQAQQQKERENRKFAEGQKEKIADFMQQTNTMLNRAQSPEEMQQILEYRINEGSSLYGDQFMQIADELQGERGIMDVASLRSRMAPLDKKADKTANIQDFEYYQALKKSDPEGAKQFGQDVGLVSREGRELSAKMQANLTQYTDDAVASGREANKFEVLADEYENLDPAAGVAGTVTEGLKFITGSQDAVSEIKKKYLGIRASQSVKNLPPGPASDKDIALALSGFPPDNANSQHVASFLRGLAKLERFNEEFNTFKSEYVSDKGHERGMLKAWNERVKDMQPESPPTAVETKEVTGDLTPEEQAEYEALKKELGM